MRQRKNLNYLTESELESYRAAILRLQSMGTADGSFSDFAAFHNKNAGSVHGTRLFLPWHRALLDRFEAALRSDPSTKDVTVPYWNWWEQDPTKDLPAAYADTTATIGGAVMANPLRPAGVDRWTVAERQELIDFFPTEVQWAKKLAGSSQWPTFGSVGTAPMKSPGFLEALHNNIHQWVGETMQQVAKSPADPVFWSHHSFVDYLWWSNQPGYQPSGAELQDKLPGMGDLTTNDVVSVSSLDYEYVVASDVLTSESVQQDGVVILGLPADLPPPEYRTARLTLQVGQYPTELFALKVCWGQDLDRAKSGGPPDSKLELNSSISLFGAVGHHEMPGMTMAMPMSGFTRVLWLPADEVEGLKSGQRKTIPLTILGYDSKQQRIVGHIEVKSAELSFLP